MSQFKFQRMVLMNPDPETIRLLYQVCKQTQLIQPPNIVSSSYFYAMNKQTPSGIHPHLIEHSLFD